MELYGRDRDKKLIVPDGDEDEDHGVNINNKDTRAINNNSVKSQKNPVVTTGGGDTHRGDAASGGTITATANSMDEGIRQNGTARAIAAATAVAAVNGNPTHGNLHSNPINIKKRPERRSMDSVPGPGIHPTQPTQPNLLCQLKLWVMQ